MAEELKKQQIALQLDCSLSSPFTWGNKQGRSKAACTWVRCTVTWKEECLIYPRALAAIWRLCLWRIYFRLRSTMRWMMFLLCFFPLVYALVLIFKDFFLILNFCHIVYLLRETIRKDIFGKQYWAALCLWAMQNLLF